MFGSKVKGIDFEIISKSHDAYIPVRLKEVLTPISLQISTNFTGTNKQ